LAEPEFVRELSKDYLRSMLQLAAQTKTPIMVFVGNPGMIQIHSGPIHTIVEHGSWINVLDPRFNMHIRHDLIGRAWIVRKPTVDGIVTSIEFFDHSGEAIAMFFGERKPGSAELASWRELVIEIEGEHGLMEVCQ
jgi:putative hemin transport protein